MVIIHKQRAFTLIELLVVISITALLMGILLPVLGKVRKQSKVIICQSVKSNYLSVQPEAMGSYLFDVCR
ncbi:MAG: type II secretion system protein [Planctomycetota bacterium]